MIERVDPRQAAVGKVRVDRGLDPRDIGAGLGVCKKRLEKISEQAYESVAADLLGPVTSVAGLLVSRIDDQVGGRPGS